MIEKFSGGPVGVDSLAAAIGEERDTIEDILEPFLIQQGFIMRTPREWRRNTPIVISVCRSKPERTICSARNEKPHNLEKTEWVNN